MLSFAVHTQTIKAMMYDETQRGGAEGFMADREGSVALKGRCGYLLTEEK